MIKRLFSERLLRLLKQFPAVMVLGARQCGKTTCVRSTLPSWTYLDLEKTSDAIPFQEDAQARLDQLPYRVCFDEAQTIPALFPLLRGVIDRERQKKGRFVLLGSAAPSLIQKAGESLAGRIGYLDMTPFCWAEIAHRSRMVSLTSFWFRGGFPEAYLERSDAHRWDWFDSYARSFVERDLTVMGIDVSTVQMRKLWMMLAHFNGNIWNASTLAASLGVSYHTVNRYVDILEQTFLVRKLPPYFSNIGKRLTRNPKVYFRDTGLLHYFLGIRQAREFQIHPARGSSWEAFVSEQVITLAQSVWPGAQPYFWRTVAGTEVDLLIDTGTRLIPFEIKLHSSPRAQNVSGLLQCMKDLSLSRGYVLYPGVETYSLGKGLTALSTQKLLEDPLEFKNL